MKSKAKALNQKQIQVICLLASGRTQIEAAEEVDCAAETISQWKHNPIFSTTLTQVRYEMLEAGRETLRSASREAASSLAQLAMSAKNEETRRKACMDIISLAGLNGSPLYAWGLDDSHTTGVGAIEGSCIEPSQM